jgi:glycosyltransferase involved in cell wall biosynthesis
MPARLCANLIVRNEAKIIERCLTSLLPAIDCWVICDTGSTDGTQDIVRAFFASCADELPGQLHEFPFRDFSQARNEAMARARASSLDFDYLLLVDADHEVHLLQADFRQHLTAAAYRVWQHDRHIRYPNVRLLRRDIVAVYRGPAHEYLDVTGDVGDCADLVIHDRCDGTRTEKYERGIRLLEAHLREHPDDRRSMYYLGQNYRDTGAYAQALRWYAKRARAGGWEEEAWHADYQTALCHQRMSNFGAFIAGMWRAYNRRPWRAEPLYHLAQWHRSLGERETVMAICEIARRIGPDHYHDMLFVEHAACPRGFDEIESIAGYYCQAPERKDAGRNACNRLAVDRDVTAPTRNAARVNLRHYARPAAECFGPVDVRELIYDCEPGYRRLNPSVCRHDGKLWCVGRTANYDLRDGAYVVTASDQVHRTRNYLLGLGDDLSVMSCQPIADRSGTGTVYNEASLVRGFEDMRLFSWRGELAAVATVRDMNPTWRCEMALLRLDENAAVTQVRVLRGHQDDRHQKNWLPVECDLSADAPLLDDLCLLYSTDPTVVLAVDPEATTAYKMQSQSCHLALGHLRGSSQVIRVAGDARGQWLYVTHEVVHAGKRDRIYLHRFVLLDDAFRVAAVSPTFYFEQKGIEFCAGLTRHGDDLLLSYGVADASAHVMRVSEQSVLDFVRGGLC